jgi:hypothetical protein
MSRTMPSRGMTDFERRFIAVVNATISSNPPVSNPKESDAAAASVA